MTRPGLPAVVVAIAACLSCGPGEEAAPVPVPVPRTVILGPAALPSSVADVNAPTLRAPLDPDGVAWITGLAATAEPEVAVIDAGVTLDVEIDLIRVSADAPSFSLPPGFGVSASGALDGLPAGWRGLHVTARALSAGARSTTSTLRVTVETVGAEDGAAVVPVWRVPITVGPAALVIESPRGEVRVSTRLSDVLPASGTIHGVVPRSGGRARVVRVVDRGDGRVACALERSEPDAVLGAWSDPVGIEVGDGDGWWLEFELPPGAARHDVAVDLYLRTAGDVELRYPQPDELGPAER